MAKGDPVLEGKTIEDTLGFDAGTTINEFSIDGTLAGNSDDAVPTEKAVKTYADAVASAGVSASTFNANTILKADEDNTPEALTIGEQTLVGRITAGDIAALTATQVRTLISVEENADVTDAVNVASSIHGVDAKATPIDADEFAVIDSAASNVLKKSTLSQIKAVLKTYFDTQYNNYALEAHAATHTNGTDDIQSASNAQKGLATAAHIQAIEANTAKATNVPTALSTGTVTATTYGITSDGGVDDVVLAEANTDSAGLLGADKFNEIVANTAARHTQGTDTALGAVGTKNPPIDADKFMFRDSESSDVLVTATGTQVKAYLKTYFDTVYSAISALFNLSEDTTPELGGELACGAHSIGFTQQSGTGDGTTTIDWKLGNKYKHTFGAQNETFTFTAPSNPCNLLLVLIQDGTGSRTVTWPATVKWAGGAAPTLTTTAAGIDIVSFYYDGTNYFGVASLAFAVPA